MLPILRAANAAVCLADSDRPQGALLVGGQGSGKTSVELRMYLNDIRDPDAAVIVIDPKSELSRLALKLTPPDCGKRVWFLDLGRPAFGMTPLRLYGDQPFASEAAAIADGIVESLLDINEGQIMQASRDLLYRSVIGALAIAYCDRRPATFEDIYSLLLPGREDAREAAFNACARIDDLDQTAEFFRKELPDDLRMSTSSTADRLRAPRNKVAGVVGVPPLRRFLNHPTDLALRTIVENRDILIVDANMAAIGEANAQAIMHFVFRQLHRQMQRQVRFPASQRPRVALICDEFHYLASRNVIKQVATHRAAGLDVTAGLQFFSQLGAGAESGSITDEIRKGVTNLLQSRCLFRLGDPDDAEQATRIAMSVYQSMIRSDPDSRAQMRVTPEAILNLPRFHCLASWIVHGQRAGSFVGQTYEMPHDASDVWAQMHLAALDARVGEYPEKMAGTLRRKLVGPEPSDTRPAGPEVADTARASADSAPTAREIEQGEPGEPHDRISGANHGARTKPPVADRAHASPPIEPDQPAAATSPRTPLAVPGQTTIHEMLAAHDGKSGPDIYEPEAPPEPDKSPVRSLVGNAPGGRGSLFEKPRAEGELPDSLRELAFIDRVNEVSETRNVVESPPKAGRLYEQDLAILKLLDRTGITLPHLIARAAMPGKSDSQVRRTMGKLHKHGLVAKRRIGIRDQREYRGQLPSAFEITRLGFETAKERRAIPDKREFRVQEVASGWRLPHDHHSVAWVIQLHRLVGDVATDNWRTPRYATGRFPLPQTGAGHKRRPIGPTDIDVPAPQAIFDLTADTFTEIKPDVCCEMHVRAIRLRFDLLVEFQHNANLSSYDDKFRHYDAFLTGWCLEHPRFKQLQTRPVVVVVAAEPKDLLDLARRADHAMKGALGIQGTPPQDWYYPGRDHIFFALEEDIHRGSLAALALPPLPPDLRARLGSEGLELARVTLLPEAMVLAAQRKAGHAQRD